MKVRVESVKWKWKSSGLYDERCRVSISCYVAITYSSGYAAARHGPGICGPSRSPKHETDASSAPISPLHDAISSGIAAISRAKVHDPSAPGPRKKGCILHSGTQRYVVNAVSLRHWVVRRHSQLAALCSSSQI